MSFLRFLALVRHVYARSSACAGRSGCFSFSTRRAFLPNIFLQNFASIERLTSPTKFDHLAEKLEKGSISNLSTKAETPRSSPRSPGSPGRAGAGSFAAPRCCGLLLGAYSRRRSGSRGKLLACLILEIRLEGEGGLLPGNQSTYLLFHLI